MTDQEREAQGTPADAEQEPGTPAREEGNIADREGQPTPTAEQFEAGKPAEEVNPPDKAATSAATSEAGKPDSPSSVQNATPDVPAAEATTEPSMPPAGQTAGWQLAGGAARQTVADQRRAERAALAPIREEEERRATLSRRSFMRAGFWGTMGMSIAGIGYCTKENLFPLNVQGFGGPIAVSGAQVPQQGDAPLYVLTGKFYLVNLAPGEGAFGGFGDPSEEGGLLALYQKCPHLGCTVPYRPAFAFQGATGWFRCPCHGSTYTKAGIRVFGPAPRPMDTMAIEPQDDGSLIVQTGQITLGSTDNALRTTPYSA
ncbi:MAG: Rieske 2Fe-2S domain-containing protein [Dehalococcoidia bacterium]|nr:Rieske 2Fe-2S domain-containing protein [Dehalococcoidia bacterium]